MGALCLRQVPVPYAGIARIRFDGSLRAALSPDGPPDGCVVVRANAGDAQSYSILGNVASDDSSGTERGTVQGALGLNIGLSVTRIGNAVRLCCRELVRDPVQMHCFGRHAVLMCVIARNAGLEDKWD